MADERVAMVRAIRLDEYERRLGTGHTQVDAKILIAEVRRFRDFLTGLSDEMEARKTDCSDCPDVAARLRNAARAHGE